LKGIGFPGCSVIQTDFNRGINTFASPSFWDNGLNSLNDHNKVSGTDVEIAIAYYDKDENFKLWFIEHKLSENEFTAFGGYRSKNNKFERNCDNTLAILHDLNKCFHHRETRIFYTGKLPKII
jgi:hypothetical protein